MAGELIPPVIIDILANDRDFVDAIAKDKALLADWAKKVSRTRLSADTKLFQSVLATVDTELLNFARRTTTTTLGADSKPFQSDLATVQSELLNFGREVNRARLGADSVTFWQEIARLRAEIKAMSPLDVNIDANISQALGKIAVLKAALDAAMLDKIGPNYGPLLGSALAGAASGGGGGGGGIAGILGALGWGGGKGIFGILPGMAKFGSILSLMGFGAEHVAASGIGIAGSMAGGLLGGGLLGMGAMGTMGVGMGTDMAGMGQALGDMRKVEQAQNAVNQAMAQYRYDVAHYGSASQAAVAALQNVQSAQANLNFTISQVPAVARGAVVALANTVQNFKSLFDKLTGPAEKIGAQILQQAVQVGEKFLPTIGKYAMQNMGIIKKDMQPFFAWMTSMGTQKVSGIPGLKGTQTLGTGGLAIFKQLEAIFQHQLPTAIRAGTQAFEFFARTTEVAARFTGGFMRAIAKLFTHMNSNKSFAGWSREVGKLIGLFHSWLDLLGSVAGVIVAVFKPAVGFGKAFADALRGIFDQLKAFLDLKGTQSALHSLFTAHLAEIIHGIGGAIRAVLPLLEGMLLGFVKVAGVMSRLAADALVPLAHFLKWVLDHPITRTLAAWGTAGFLAYKGLGQLATAGKGLIGFVKDLPAGISLLVGKFKGLASTLGNVASSVASFVSTAASKFASFASSVGSAIASGISSIGQFIARIATAAVSTLASLGSMAAGFLGVEIESSALNAALGVGVIAGIVLLGVAIYELVTHWKVVWRTIKTVARDVWSWLRAAARDTWNAIRSTAVAVWNAIKGALQTAWHAIESAAKTVWNAIKGFFHSTLGQIVLFVMNPVAGLANFLYQHWNTIRHDAVTAWHAVLSFIKAVPGEIVAAFKGAGTLLWNVGKSIIDGLLRGLKSVGHTVMHYLHDLTSWIPKWKGPSSKDASLLTPAGQLIMKGLVGGFKMGIPRVIASLHTVTSAITRAFGSLGKAKSLASAEVALKNLGKALTSLTSAVKVVQDLSTNVQALQRGADILKMFATEMAVFVLKVGSLPGLSAASTTLEMVAQAITALGTAAKSLVPTATGLTTVTLALNTLRKVNNGALRSAITAFAVTLGVLTRQILKIHGLSKAIQDLARLGKTLATLVADGKSLPVLATGMRALIRAINELAGIRNGAKKIENLIRDVREFAKGIGSIRGLGGDIAKMNALSKALTLFTKTMQAMATTGGKALAALGGVFEVFTSKVTEVLRGLSTAAQAIFTLLYKAIGIQTTNFAAFMATTFSGMAGQIEGIMRGVAGTMQGIGLSISQGLANGILAGIPAIVAAAQAAAAAVAAATRTATGTHSPSRVFAVIGRDLMAGLAQGILQSRTLPNSAAALSFAGVASQARMGMAEGARSAGGGTQNIEVHITVMGGNSPAATGNAVHGAVLDAMHQALTSARAGAGSVYP